MSLTEGSAIPALTFAEHHRSRRPVRPCPFRTPPLPRHSLVRQLKHHGVYVIEDALKMFFDPREVLRPRISEKLERHVCLEEHSAQCFEHHLVHRGAAGSHQKQCGV